MLRPAFAAFPVIADEEKSNPNGMDRECRLDDSKSLTPNNEAGFQEEESGCIENIASSDFWIGAGAS